MPKTVHARHALIYALIAALIAPIVLLRGKPTSPTRSTPAAPHATPRLRIRDVRVESVSESAATITWSTNLPADSQATYGKYTPYEMGSPRDEKLRLRHRVVLRGLESGETYRVCLVSEAPEAGIAAYDGLTLRTSGVAGFRNGAAMEEYAALAELPSRATCAAAIDYDNDGDLDLLACAENSRGARLLRNADGALRVLGGDVGVAEHARSVGWADYDGDGDWDLVMSSSWKLNLFENAGPPKWRFRNANALLPPQRRYSLEGVVWLDYNRDGLPDILASNGAYGLLLYRNTGKARPRFEDVSESVGLGRKGLGVGLSDFPAVADLDNDGYPDFLYNLRARGVLAVKNEAGKRFRVVENTGLSFVARQRVAFALGDYDNDGDLDVFVPLSTGNRLYRNDGGFRFKDVTAQAGDLRGSRKGCSAAWGDVDNDGDLDLYLGRWYAADALFANQGGGVFADKSRSFRLAANGPVTARGIVLFDADNDGDLELFVNNYRGPNLFYVNQTVIAGQRNFLRVELGPQPPPLNARVELRTLKGKLVGCREVCRGEGWGGQTPPVAYFGCPPGHYVVKVTYSNRKVVKRTIQTSQSGRNVLRIP